MKDLSKRKRRINKIIIITILLSVVLISTGAVLTYIEYTNQKNNKIHLEKVQTKYKNIFENNKPKDDLTINKVQAIKKDAKSIKLYENETKKIINELSELEAYLELKADIENCYEGTIMFSTVTKENINTMKTKNKKLSKEYQKYTNNYIIDLESQRSNIDMTLKPSA